VGIRAVREAYGLTIKDLVTRIAEQGVTVKDTATIRNVETGHKRPSTPLLVAWAKALKLNPVDVVLPGECDCGEQDAA
jgi:transcriptional regulator with XRE-family HTH domain